MNATLSDVGFLNFNVLSSMKKKDFENSSGIYFINSSFSTPNIKKLLNLKLLNFFQNHKDNNKILMTQSSNLDTKSILQLKKSFSLNNHLHLPNTVLFETSGTYINTSGDINKITKIVTPLGQAKSD